MVLLVVAAALFGRVLPTWTLSLATVAASNALIALGIVILARTGNVSFGQGLFYAAGGYGVALIANAWGITDAVAQMLIGAVCGGLLGLADRSVDRPLQRHLLRHADARAVDGAVRRAGQIDRARRLRRLQRRTAEPVRHGLHRPARGGLHAVCGLGGHDRASPASPRRSCSARNSAWSASRFAKTICASSISEFPPIAIITINFAIAAVFAGASGAFALMAQRHIDPQFAYWTTSGEFVFVAVLAGYQSVAAVFVASLALELVRSFSNLYLPNTWQLVLGLFLLGVILFLPRGIGSLWVRRAAQEERARGCSARRGREEAAQ